MNKTLFYAVKSIVNDIKRDINKRVPNFTKEDSGKTLSIVNGTSVWKKSYGDFDAILKIDFTNPGESMDGNATLTMLQGNYRSVVQKITESEPVHVMIILIEDAFEKGFEYPVSLTLIPSVTQIWHPYIDEDPFVRFDIYHYDGPLYWRHDNIG